MNYPPTRRFAPIVLADEIHARYLICKDDNSSLVDDTESAFANSSCLRARNFNARYTPSRSPRQTT